MEEREGGGGVASTSVQLCKTHMAPHKLHHLVTAPASTGTLTLTHNPFGQTLNTKRTPSPRRTPRETIKGIHNRTMYSPTHSILLTAIFFFFFSWVATIDCYLTFWGSKAHYGGGWREMTGIGPPRDGGCVAISLHK